MHFEEEILVNERVDVVWAVYSDVEHWPEWTASVEATEYLAGHELAVGARVRIKQPKLPTAVWEVCAVDPGRSWTWVATGPGVRTTARHTLESVGAHTTRVQMTLEQRGLLGGVIGRLYAQLTRTYLAMEAAGLKERSEARAST